MFQHTANLVLDCQYGKLLWDKWVDKADFQEMGGTWQFPGSCATWKCSAVLGQVPGAMGWEDANTSHSANAAVPRKENRSEAKPSGAGGRKSSHFSPSPPNLLFTVKYKPKMSLKIQVQAFCGIVWQENNSSFPNPTSLYCLLTAFLLLPLYFQSFHFPVFFTPCFSLFHFHYSPGKDGKAYKWHQVSPWYLASIWKGTWRTW